MLKACLPVVYPSPAFQASAMGRFTTDVAQPFSMQVGLIHTRLAVQAVLPKNTQNNAMECPSPHSPAF